MNFTYEYSLIPTTFKQTNLNTTDKKTYWTLRVDTKDTLYNYKNMVTFATTYCEKFILGNIETGTREHVHIAFQLKTTKSQSALAKLIFGTEVIEYMLHMSEYCLLPSAHYWDSNIDKKKIFTYAIKNGITYIYPPDFEYANSEYESTNDAPMMRSLMTPEINPLMMELEDDEPEVPPKQNYESKQIELEAIATLYGLTIDKDKSELFTCLLTEYGPKTAKRLMTSYYNSTVGKNIRKSTGNVKDDFDTEKMMEGGFCNLWIYGPAGTGKTNIVARLHPNRYMKKKTDEFWETLNYEDMTFDNPHMAVHFDEICTHTDMMAFGNGKTVDAFKEMFGDDRFPIQIKHEAQAYFRFKRGYVTSNDPPINIFRAVESLSTVASSPLYKLDFKEFKKAIERRFHIVHIDDVLKV